MMKQDPVRGVDTLLVAAVEHARAGSAAVLVDEGGRCHRVAQWEYTEDDHKHVAVIWAASSRRTGAGDDWAVTELGNGAFLYLGQARRPLTPGVLREVVDQLGPMVHAALTSRREAQRLYEWHLSNLDWEDIARDWLRMMLRRHGGKKAAAARALGWSRRKLYLHLQRYGITETGREPQA